MRIERTLGSARLIRDAGAAGQGIGDYTERYTEAFLDDLATLNIDRPDVMPRATEHIDDMVALIETLIEKGHAYESEGSVYFDISSFAGYGLCHQGLAGAGRADQQHTLGNAGTQSDEFLRFTQEFDHLF